MSISQRITEFMEKKKFTPPEFYKPVGIGRIEFSSWVNSGKAISVMRIVSILRTYPEINARWFLTGDGEMMEGMISENTPPPVECESCKSKDKIIEMHIDHIATLKNTFANTLADKQEIIDLYKKR